jgi:hypothetical protein
MKEKQKADNPIDKVEAARKRQEKEVCSVVLKIE